MNLQSGPLGENTIRAGSANATRLGSSYEPRAARFAACVPLRHGLGGYGRIRTRGTAASVLHPAASRGRGAGRPTRLPLRCDAIRRRAVSRRPLGPCRAPTGPYPLPARRVVRPPAARAGGDASFALRGCRAGRCRERDDGDGPGLYSRHHPTRASRPGAGPHRRRLRPRPHGRPGLGRPPEPPLAPYPGLRGLRAGARQRDLRPSDTAGIAATHTPHDDPHHRPQSGLAAAGGPWGWAASVGSC